MMPAVLLLIQADSSYPTAVSDSMQKEVTKQKDKDRKEIMKKQDWHNKKNETIDTAIVVGICPSHKQTSNRKHIT